MITDYVEYLQSLKGKLGVERALETLKISKDVLKRSLSGNRDSYRESQIHSQLTDVQQEIDSIERSLDEK